MTMIKRGVCGGEVVVAGSVYRCPSCGHTDVGDGNSPKTCPKCQTEMEMVSYTAEAEAGGVDDPQE